MKIIRGTIFKASEFLLKGNILYSLIVANVLLYERAVWAMVPKRKSGRTSLGIHLAAARNARSSVSLRPFAGRKRNRNARNAAGIASYESIMSRVERTRKEEKGRKRKSDSALRVARARSGCGRLLRRLLTVSSTVASRS